MLSLNKGAHCRQARHCCLIRKVKKAESYGDGLGTLATVEVSQESVVLGRWSRVGVQLLKTNLCYSGSTLTSGSSLEF